MTRTRRQSRRQSEFRDAEETDSTAGPTPSFTANDMASIMASIQETQTAAFERLLDRVLDHETRRASSSPTPGTPTASAAPAHHPGNFASCTARFSGAPGDSLDGFIDAVEAYKECARVGDDNALRGVSMLLSGDAAVWWQGIKATITSWSDAVTSLRSAFGDSRPPHRIYLDLFDTFQGPREKTEIFVARARALLARLPPDDLSEKVQIDMVYGLLHNRVRQRLRRDEVRSFDMLLRKARHIEDAFDEAGPSVRNNNNATRHRASQRNAGGAPAAAETPTPPQPPRFAPTMPRERGLQTSSAGARDSTSSSSNDKHRPPRENFRPAAADKNKSRFCDYCKNYGHSRDQCFKLASKPNTGNDNMQAEKVPPTCYGCNEPGVTRSQCRRCNSEHFAIG